MTKAVAKIFPHVHPSSCAVHICWNVLNSYGLQASNMIPKIVACYLAMVEDSLFENKKAEKYVKILKLCCGGNIAYMDLLLPPCYGILLFNGVELANNMFSLAKKGLWLCATQFVLYDMSKKIMVHQQKYNRVNGKLLYDKVCGDFLFKASKSYDVTVAVNNSHIIFYKNANMTYGMMHKVILSIAVCSCGWWHTILLPCHHTMAWAQQVHQWTF